MNRKYLIIDANYLCHRAKHSTGGLKHGDTPTGVIFGFLKTIIALQAQFRTKHIIFCWDSKTSKREEIFPAYKKKRKNRYKDLTEEEIEFEKEFRLQMKKLRRVYLKRIGYRNIFCQKGYEGDDLIASVCFNNIKNNDEAIIITADQDLYQLIRFNISFYNPQKGKLLTLQRFKKKYGIIPEWWDCIKAIAGCSTDEVPGVKGVGEKTAIAYMLNNLKKDSKIFIKIKKFCWDKESRKKLFLRNMQLVSLPFEGVKTFKLKEDKISKQGWKEVVRELGLASLGDITLEEVTKHKRNLL